MVADVSDSVWEFYERRTTPWAPLNRGVKSVRFNDYEKSNSIVGAVL